MMEIESNGKKNDHLKLRSEFGSKSNSSLSSITSQSSTGSKMGHEMRSRLDSAHKSVDMSSARSNSLNKSESIGGGGPVGRSDSTITGAEESPRRLMGLKWNQGGMNRLGKGTKNWMDKWKTHSSKSIDIGGGPKLNGSQESFERADSKEMDKTKPESERTEKKSTWTEHIWSTFIHRGYSDDVTESEPKLPGKECLTAFQIDKFKYFFYQVLDQNSDHVISEEDFIKLNDRIRHYMDWSVNEIHFLALKEVHDIFKEFFLYKSAEINRSKTKPNHWEPFAVPPDLEVKPCVTVDEWLEVWGNLVYSARNIHDLPMWLQYYPKILFDTINRSGTGVISKKELQLFYTAFLDVGRLGEKKIRMITEKAHDAMTANGDVKLNFHIYRLSFLNFLLGKQPNGPGQYIFGAVSPSSGKTIFTVDYSALNSTSDETETFSHDKLENKGFRKSVIV